MATDLVWCPFKIRLYGLFCFDRFCLLFRIASFAVLGGFRALTEVQGRAVSRAGELSEANKSFKDLTLKLEGLEGMLKASSSSSTNYQVPPLKLYFYSATSYVLFLGASVCFCFV